MSERERSSGTDEPEAAPLETESPLSAVQEVMGQINAVQAGRKLESLDVSELEDIKNKYLAVRYLLGLKQEQETGAGFVLSVKNEKGEPAEFNFEQIKNYWVDFYKKNNLPELAEVVEELEITLTKEQQDRIKELAEKEGFDKMIIFAGNEIMQKNSAGIKQETEKEMAGLAPKQQYMEKDKDGKPVGTYLSDTVKPAFPDKIKNNNRPDKPYILFCKDAPEVDEATRKALKESEGKGEKKNSAENLREYFKKKGLTGYTLEEYLIFQREHTTQNKEAAKPHPENDYSTWLLDSELDAYSSGPGRVLQAGWSPGDQRVGVGSDAPDGSDSDVGARSSAIFEIL
ncbi:MAG: hypothetical protein Q7S10_01870 [bacterium]|nr:hypothetical protein [bacterium]